MSDNDELIQQFMQITGCDDVVAKLFLERAAYDFEAAVAEYFGESEDATIEPKRHIGTETNNLNVNPQIVKSKKPASNIHTMSSMRERKESPENKGQAFYVGGSEHGGGQQVIGPRQTNKPTDVDELFKLAKEHGAQVVERPAPGPSSAGRSTAFAGSGFRLGDSAPVGSPVNAEQEEDSLSNVQQVKVIVWSNGFTIDNGPLRSMEDPESAEFARVLATGRIPRELIAKYKKRIELDMENRSDEEYKAPLKPKIIAFEGTGMTLGSPTPKVVQSSHTEQSQPIQKQESPITVDENAPTTQLQIRLANNQREVLRLNRTHTIGDIRRHIISQYPEYNGRSFNLMTTFPNKVLSDDSATVAESNLLNAQIIQRLT